MSQVNTTPELDEVREAEAEADAAFRLSFNASLHKIQEHRLAALEDALFHAFAEEYQQIAWRRRVLDEQYERIKHQLDQQEDRLARVVQPQILAALEVRGVKHVDTLAGRVQSRQVSETIHIDDLDAALIWAKANLPSAIKIKESVQLKPIKDHFLATGEMPPGTSYIPERISVHVQPTKSLDTIDAPVKAQWEQP